MIGIFLDDERNPEDVTWINYPKNIVLVLIMIFLVKKIPDMIV